MIDRILELSAKHRALVLLLAAVLFAGGLVAMKNVRLDAIPDLSDPQVIVFTEWMGRSPTLVEDQVTYPLVTALTGTPNVVDVRGQSMFGMSFVYVVFSEGTDLYWARSRVSEQLATVRARLPVDAQSRLGPDASGIGWIYQYALVDRTGHTDLGQLRALHDVSLRYALGSVQGVAEVATLGGFEPQYQITVDPVRLRARGLELDDVAAALRDANGESSGRILEIAEREGFVRGRGYVTSQDDLAAAVIGTDGAGIPVRVRDVATVAMGPQIRRGAADFDGLGEAVGGIVVMRHGENALAVIERVEAKLDELRATLPAGVEIVPVYDRSSLVERAIETLQHALGEEIAIVCLVILIFLLHPRSALLPAISLPLVVALAFIPMAIFGIPATIMSLGGIAIAIGATVDAEIVMIEACHKRLEHAPDDLSEEDRSKLLASAAREVTPAIFFSLLILATSFLPVFGLTGQAGRLFRPLAFTKTFVMLAAALVSITVGPALRDFLIRGKIRSEANHPISKAIRRFYSPFVHAALRNPKTTILLGVFAVVSAIPIASRLGNEFMPPLDEGDLLYMPTTLPGISIEEARRVLAEQDRILRTFPEVRSVLGKVGRAETATDPAPLSMVETVVQLQPPETWRTSYQKRWYVGTTPRFMRPFLSKLWPEFAPMSRADLIDRMNHALRVPGFTNAFTQPIRNRIDMLATGIRTPVGIKVYGHELDAIERAGASIEQVVRRVRGTRSVLFERSSGGLYVDVVPDREAIGRYGISVADVNEVIETAIGGRVVTTTIEGRQRFTVNLRAGSSFRDDVASLEELTVRGVRLGSIATVRTTSGPAMVRDEASMLVGYVYVDVDDSRDLGSYVEDVRAAVEGAVAAGSVRLPEGGYVRYTGEYEQMLAMRERMRFLVPIALIVTVVLLYLQFRNLTEALIVLLSIPFAWVGSFWALHLLGYSLSTAVWVGLIALVGLAAQTGVVMIVYIDHAYERRLSEGRIHTFEDIVDAHSEGTIERVRPKLMTVGTMLAGLLPLLWAEGSGADVMRRIAAPMVGGLITSAFLTLEIIPVIYTYWRYEQLVHRQLATNDPPSLALLKSLMSTAELSLVLALGLAAVRFFLDRPAAALEIGAVAFGVGFAALAVTYIFVRSRLAGAKPALSSEQESLP